MAVPQVVLLARAREIQDEYGSSVGFFAHTKNGERCSALSPEAVSFDILGALRLAAVETGTTDVHSEVLGALEEYVIESGYECLSEFNDTQPAHIIHKAYTRLIEQWLSWSRGHADIPLPLTLAGYDTSTS